MIDTHPFCRRNPVLKLSTLNFSFTLLLIFVIISWPSTHHTGTRWYAFYLCLNITNFNYSLGLRIFIKQCFITCHCHNSLIKVLVRILKKIYYLTMISQLVIVEVLFSVFVHWTSIQRNCCIACAVDKVSDSVTMAAEPLKAMLPEKLLGLKFKSLSLKEDFNP